ncbi:hypothetical protein VIN13_5222 [Saccharomyces cerevisiae Vin13]|nr:hypothetical protein VIN13_5222 [Saccharomyces cerevisiae Vin13]
MYIYKYIYIYISRNSVPLTYITIENRTTEIYMKYLLFSFFFATLFTMVSAQSDFIQAELHNINNSVTTDSEFSFHDFENDIGNTLPYRKQLVSGHIIEYDSDSGFSITHPDIIGEIKVDDVLQAYKEAFKSNFSAYTTYISANYLVQFSPWQSNIFKKLNHTAQVEKYKCDGNYWRH